jgi:hypothetical protein
MGTLMENITLGQTDISTEMIIQQANKLGFLNFLQYFPSGFDTVLDPLGKKLSESLKKKILLIRATIGNKSLLLLEEPWSGLPIETTAPSDTTPSASNEPARAEPNALTLERAYDFIFAELGRSGEPMLSQVETALRARALQASAGDVAQATRSLGKAAPTVVAETTAARKRATPVKKKS